MLVLSGLAAVENIEGHGGGDSGSKDGDSPAATIYGYGDDSSDGDDSADSDNEDDFPVYGYGRNTERNGAYGYGDDDDDNKGNDDDDDKGGDYGYGEDKDAGSPAGDYGYGDEATPSIPSLLDLVLPTRPRCLRRNSYIIRKDQNPLAVAEYLLGGPPRMSDRDMELNIESALSA